MLNIDYARLGLASLAALGVHGLLFWNFNGVEVLKHSESLMQIQIIPQASSQPQKPAQTITHQPVIQHVQHDVADMPKPIKEREVANAQPIAKVNIQPEKVDDSAQNQQQREPILVPQNVQSLVITNIDYPRRARYRGWQGEAELRFGVESSRVQNIQLFLSTGFKVLDQAAYQALASLASLPLNDGFYRLPVVFKLQ